MEPGDQIIAGTLAMPGAAPAWDALAALPALAAGIAASLNFFTSASNPTLGAVADIGVLSTFCLMLPLQFRRGPVFLAATQRQLICYRLSRFGNEPMRPLFCAPLASVRITSLRSALPPWKSVPAPVTGACGSTSTAAGARILTKCWPPCKPAAPPSSPPPCPSPSDRRRHLPLA
jgi:hypothetical protein